MNNAHTILIVGNAFGGEKGMIEFNVKNICSDGIDTIVRISLLEFELRVETFFFGFNLKVFVEQALAATLDHSASAKLFNYDQTLEIEVVHLAEGEEFLSVRYKSIAPDRPTSETLSEICRVSKLASGEDVGSIFHLSFMKLDTSVLECSSQFGKILMELKISTENPYGDGPAKL